MHYNHRDHAGNAGDVWKHFILAEVAKYRLTQEKELLYVESHVGYPEYLLAMPGKWQDGIGKCWRCINNLREFNYFQILDRMNPAGLHIYPGSATLILRMADELGFVVKADVWDIDPTVSSSWHDIALPGSDKLRFHFGDGFSGVRSLIERSDPALLLIDPPYLEKRDIERSADLFEKAAISDWTVLLWQMTDVDVGSNDLANYDKYNHSIKKYSINFSDIGLNCGKWRGAAISLAGTVDLQDYICQKVRKFLSIMRYQKLFWI